MQTAPSIIFGIIALMTILASAVPATIPTADKAFLGVGLPLTVPGMLPMIFRRSPQIAFVYDREYLASLSFRTARFERHAARGAWQRP